MTDKEKIKAEIDKKIAKKADEFAEREYETDGYERQWLSKGYYHVFMDANKGKLKEPVCDDLEEAIDHYEELVHGFESLNYHDCIQIARYFAKWGSDWQKEQMMKDAFVFEDKHNTACVLASECLRNHGWFQRERDFNSLWRYISTVKKLFCGEFHRIGQTKIIVVKED